jgi:hypothetical protein
MHDALIRQIEEATEDAFRIVGVTGGDEARMGFVAVERESGALVALSLVGEELRVHPRLDAAVPVDGSRCAQCGGALAVWVDACPRCGARIVGDELPGAHTEAAREALLDGVRRASQGAYEVLGAMDGAEGSVYFAREAEGGALVALALQAEYEDDDECSLVATWLAPGEAPPAAAPRDGYDPDARIPDPEAPRAGWLRRILGLR